MKSPGFTVLEILAVIVLVIAAILVIWQGPTIWRYFQAVLDKPIVEAKISDLFLVMLLAIIIGNLGRGK